MSIGWVQSSTSQHPLEPNCTMVPSYWMSLSQWTTCPPIISRKLSTSRPIWVSLGANMAYLNPILNRTRDRPTLGSALVCLMSITLWMMQCMLLTAIWKNTRASSTIIGRRHQVARTRSIIWAKYCTTQLLTSRMRHLSMIARSLLTVTMLWSLWKRLLLKHAVSFRRIIIRSRARKRIRCRRQAR